MGWSCQILADSQAPSESRLTTMVLTYPRFVHSELMTHREFSRNAASSRAIPTSRTMQAVKDDPALPIHWGRKQKGMQADEQIGMDAIAKCAEEIRGLRDQAVTCVQSLTEHGLHKQVANRYLEPWMWMTTIVSATNWANFFHLRCARDAQPELRKIATMALLAYRNSSPTHVPEGVWHTPLLFPEDSELDQEARLKVSAARCARVSYLTHDGRRDIQADLDLFERLTTAGHWSPLEHVAKAVRSKEASGNIWGWVQLRKCYSNEVKRSLSAAEMDTLLEEMEKLGALDA